MQTDTTDRILLVNGSWGIYAPESFARRCGDYIRATPGHCGVDLDDLGEIANGPDSPDYWEAWDCVLADFRTTDARGTWYLECESDVFLVLGGDE